MALEQVFSCPRTLARLRANPLGRLLEEFCRWLLDGGFSRGCIRKHLCYAAHLNQHLGTGADPPRERLSARDVASRGFSRPIPATAATAGRWRGTCAGFAPRSTD